jgi:Zn-dependent protease with chaperone function
VRFFEEQARARRRTALLVFLFALTVITIVGAVAVVTVLFAGADGPNLAWWTAGAALLLIGATSAFQLHRLGRGGGQVAEALGGTPIPPDSNVLAHRRLRNVVEEMAIASGLPAPEIFVLEDEPGINAFAAGVRPSHAAVAVTRGALDRLTRDELQGVIAHEFSHVLNGDMRLNTRLIGWLAGIEALALIGRVLVGGMRHGRLRTSGRGRNASVILIAGVVVLLIGYAGLLGGGLIRAAVSRQREILADASAVQFTRQTSGLAGALKKILALNLGGRAREAGSALAASDCERVSHMLFAPGLHRARLMATHPPLPWRIQRLDPSFDAEAFATSSEREALAPAATAGAQASAGLAAGNAPRALDADSLQQRVGNPDAATVEQAHALLEAMPERLGAAAHSPGDVGLAVLACIIGEVDGSRFTALARSRIGDNGLARLDLLREDVADMPAELRLAGLEIALPALRRMPPAGLGNLRDLLDRLVALSAETGALGDLVRLRVATGYLDDLGVSGVSAAAAAPQSRAEAMTTLLAVLAARGHDDETAAEAAFRSGLACLTERQNAVPYAPPEAAVLALDGALARLADLDPPHREALVRAIAATATHDGVVSAQEAELVRGLCALLGVPVPPLAAAAGR